MSPSSFCSERLRCSFTLFMRWGTGSRGKDRNENPIDHRPFTRKRGPVATGPCNKFLSTYLDLFSIVLNADCPISGAFITTIIVAN
ncbi:hypothetical protein ALP01_04569 [Pseudomonas caricapapayae]|nr:hypothetical protein ALP01_04569 [Pseudomonas caricapapayae]